MTAAAAQQSTSSANPAPPHPSGIILGSDRVEAQVYRLYAQFLDAAERERRWNPYRDIPWQRINRHASPELALCAETFCAVESYLPDYVSQGVHLMRDSFGLAWFFANWGYEESKHGLSLMEYLIRSGQRSEAQMFDLQAGLKRAQWQLPFQTRRQMTLYGIFQEMSTFVIYCRQERCAERENDLALRAIYRLAARDEIAHARFYKDVTRILLLEDRAGVIADLAHVLRHFQMPGVALVPDYDARVALMRDAGIDRDTFLRKVYFPTLKYLGIERAELVAAARTGRAGGSNR